MSLDFSIQKSDRRNKSGRDRLRSVVTVIDPGDVALYFCNNKIRSFDLVSNTRGIACFQSIVRRSSKR